MSYLRKIHLLVSFLLYPILVSAQSGTIRGTVTEDATGEPLIGVTVLIKGMIKGSTTDFDGKFEIIIKPGTYNLQVSFISFQTLTINGLVINADQVTLLDQLRLKEDIEVLEEVVITAEVVKTTEEALLTVKRKSINLIDGISAAGFRKTGDSDAALATKRITGVSVEGGRYVYVRGLGDRYTKSILNGVDVPGLDPDRNTLQLDIFPTNVLNNIIVSKSFTADLPADFTGGIVNIETKDFPDLKTMNVSVGLGYNPSMHFNSTYTTYEGGGTDFLGFDDGTRDLPFSDNEILVSANGKPQPGVVLNPTGQKGTTYIRHLRSFNPVLTAIRESSFMDYNLGFSTGNQFEKGRNTFGYNFAFSYRNSTEFYGNATYNRYGLADNVAINELEVRESQFGDFGYNNVLVGGLAGIALRRDRANYRINLLHLQNGESRAGIFTFIGSDLGSDFTSFQHNLEYTERQMTNVMLAGEHHFEQGNWNVEWKVAPTRSVLDDPDIRFTRYEIRASGDFSITSEGGFPERIWRELNEDNLVMKVDVAKEYQLSGRNAKLKFGVANTFKERDYNIRRFQFVVDSDIKLTGDPNEILAEENLYPQGGNQFDGNYFNVPFLPNNPNFYESAINNIAFYVSAEVSATDKLKAVFGIRAEDYTQKYTGINQLATIVSKDSIVIDEFEFYPAVNLIYSLTDRQNIRASYSRTTARFSFKEATYAQIFDPLTGRTFNGALNRDEDPQIGDVFWDGHIKSTLIDNFDLRWEFFKERGQTISVSGFYKKFTNVIEIVQSATVDNNFQPRNVGNASVIGGEFELRQGLEPISPHLSNFQLNANITVLDSRIDMSNTEFNSRVANAREGQVIKRTRDLQGQAPYIINVGLSYDGLNNGLEAGLFYNVQGGTQVFTGIADRPDIFSVPFNSVNFNANKTFGPEERIRLGMKVSNILRDKKEQVYRSFGSSDKFFQSLSPGTRISVSFRYSFL